LTAQPGTPGVLPQVALSYWIVISLLGQDADLITEAKLPSSVARLLDVLTQLHLSSGVEGDATYRVLLDTLRAFATTTSQATWGDFIEETMSKLQTHPRSPGMWLGELLAARPGASEHVGEFLCRQTALRELLRGAPQSEGLFVFSDSVFANMLLHQTMSSAPHYEQLQTLELESARAAAAGKGQGDTSAPAMTLSRVALTPLDTQTNGTVLSHLAELADQAAAGEVVQSDDFFSSSPLIRPQSQLGLEEQQKQLRSEIRFLKDFMLASLSAKAATDGAAASSSSPPKSAAEGKAGAGRVKEEDKKTYCSSCGTRLLLSPESSRVVSRILSSRGLPPNPYSIADAARAAAEAAEAAAEAGRQAKGRREEGGGGEAAVLDGPRPQRDRKPAGPFVPYKGTSRTTESSTDEDDEDEDGAEAGAGAGATKHPGGRKKSWRGDHSVSKKAVIQFDLSTGAILGQFDSGSGASRLTKVHSNSISRCCQGKTMSGGGFGWRFLSELSKQERRAKTVNIVNVGEEEEEEEESEEEENASFRNLSQAILAVEKAHAKALHVFQTKAAFLGDQITHIKGKKMAVLKRALKEAAERLGVAIPEFCSTNGKSIEQVDPATMRVKAQFLSGVEAAATTKIPRTTISSCCRGTNPQGAGGWIWRFAVKEIKPEDVLRDHPELAAAVNEREASQGTLGRHDKAIAAIKVGF